ncbi:MAG: hypothetical protein WBW73_08250 [Rhodoplanes sp.]
MMTVFVTSCFLGGSGSSILGSLLDPAALTLQGASEAGALQRDVVSVERRDECWHSRAPEPASACDGEPKVEGRRLFLFGRREWLHSEQAAYDIRRVLERIIGEMGVARRGLDAAMPSGIL